MRLAEIFKSSLATLRMNGRRTFLTMIGIIIGVAAVITILSLGNGFKKQTLDELAKDDQGRPSQTYMFQPSDWNADISKTQPFNEKILEEIKAIPGVDEVKLASDLYNKTGYFTFSYANQDPMGFEVGFEDKTVLDILVGRNLMPEDGQAVKRNLIISETIAMQFFQDPSLALHQSIQLDQTSYTVVGVYMTSMEDLEANNGLGGMGFGMGMGPEAYIPRLTNEKLNPNQVINWEIQVFYQPDVDIKTINKTVGDYLTKYGPEKDNGTYSYFDQSEMMEAIGQQLNMITYFISAVAGISLFIAGVGVMNMMYISVSERTREIGTRRSLGATQSSIQWQFLLEGITITTLGGLIGYGLGVLLATVSGNFLPFKAALDVPTALLAVFISVFIGIVFSVFPARAAARKNVVEILR